jgi:predicted transcriptional regulator
MANSGTAAPRGASGRFEATEPRDAHDLYEIVRVVAEAAAAADPDPFQEPRRVTTRAFNAIKDEVAAKHGYGHIPQAHEICRQLAGVNGKPFPWRGLLDVVFSDIDLTRLQVQRQAATQIQVSEYLREEHVYYALNRAAQLLEQCSLLPDEYEHARAELIRRDRSRFRHGGHLEHLLPTVSQILSLTGDDWDAALVLADLAPRPRKVFIRPSVPLVDALVRFYKQTGGWCSSDTIARYARDLKFPLQNRGGIHWHEYIAGAITALHAEGIAPVEYDRRKLIRVYEIPAKAGDGELPRYAKFQWKEQRSACLRALKEFKAECRRRKMPVTTASYRILSKGRTDWPGSGALQHHGGFRALLKEAGTPGAIKRAEAEEAARRSPEAVAAAAQRQLEKKASSSQAEAVYALIAEHDPIGAAELAKRLSWAKRRVGTWLQILKAAGRIEADAAGTAKNVRYRLPRLGPPTDDELEQDEARRRQERLQAKGPQTALQLIRERGPLSTAEIARVAGRSQATVREHWIKPLVDEGLLVAIDERLTKAEGWRRRRYRLAAKDGLTH